MVRQGWLIVGVLVFSVMSTGCGGDATDEATNGTSGWAALPVKISADQSISASPGAQQDLADAMAFWEAKAGKKLFEYQGLRVGGQAFSGTQQAPGTIYENVIYFLGAWPYSDGSVGKTIAQWSDTQLKAALVQINTTGGSLCAGDCTGQSFRTSQRRTIAHELGHFLGLSHSDDKSNIMYPSIQPGSTLSGMTIDGAALANLVDGR